MEPKSLDTQKLCRVEARTMLGVTGGTLQRRVSPVSAPQSGGGVGVSLLFTLLCQDKEDTLNATSLIGAYIVTDFYWY